MPWAPSTLARLIAVAAAVGATACAAPPPVAAPAATPVAVEASSRSGNESTPARPVATASAPRVTSSAPRATSSAPRAAALPLTGRVIVIDPGHNGGNARNASRIARLVDVGNGRKACDTTGTQTDGGYPEHAFTWDLANRLATILRAQGATVVLTRANDIGVGPCITDRAAIGNRASADAAISLHADGAARAGHGFHVIAPAPVGGNTAIVAPSRRLAVAVRSAFARGTGEPYSTYTGGGTAITVRKDLGGLNLSRVPKVFIECANMRNGTDAARLGDAAWRQTAARSLANGLSGFVLAERAR